MPTETSGKTPAPSNDTPPHGVRFRWDDRDAKTAYANACNVASTKEEVILFFGLRQTWKARPPASPASRQAGQREVPVQVTDRIILSPVAAKRLALLLTRVVKDHEARFGALPGPKV
jgi:hypothetical protein